MPGATPKKKGEERPVTARPSTVRPTTPTAAAAAVRPKTSRANVKPSPGGTKPTLTPEQRALNRQWIEYNLSYLVKTPTHHSQNILRELDFALLPYTFFTGNFPSSADHEIYYSLYPTYSTMSFQEKEKYVSLSRWFRLIQEDDELRGKRDKLPFSRTPLY